MEIYDEYTGVTYAVPPEEELLVSQMIERGATTPEIVDVLQLPRPEATEDEPVFAFFPAVDGGVVSVDEIPELNEES